MTDPITPPSELVLQWEHEWNTLGRRHPDATHTASYVAIRAAQWGADMELKACVNWLDDTDCEDPQEVAQRLRSARRPKPPSLKEEALSALESLQQRTTDPNIIEPLRRALEALDD